MGRFNALLFFIFASHAHCQYTDIWRIGALNDGTSGMSIESHASENYTISSPQAIDDHYFLAGTYDTVGTINDEPLSNFERALTGSDPENYIYFTLPASVIESEKEVVLQVQTDWGGFTQPDPDNPIAWHHVMKISLNGTDLGNTKEYSSRETFNINIPKNLLNVGANTLRLERVEDNNNAYTNFDSIALVETEQTFTDTDDDGVTDTWEMVAGTDPALATSTPPPLVSAIGINFFSADTPEEGTWFFKELNGFIPQTNWNQIGPLRQWPINGGAIQTTATPSVNGPHFSQLSDASGNAIPGMAISTQHYRTPSNHNHLGTPASKLLRNFLDSSNSYPVEINLSGIPYSDYDLIVYVSTDYTGPSMRLQVNGSGFTEQLCSPESVVPQADFRYNPRSANTIPPFTNVVKFKALTGSNLTLSGYRYNFATAGVAAIQIIDRVADADADSIPDWYELEHGMKYADASDAALNNDTDNLTNAEEYTALTNPNKADSDGDGLNDDIETNTGTYLNAGDTGTNPNWADTDGDGISDAEEIQSPFFSNPHLTDTDNDGKEDKQERDEGTNPNSAGVSGFGAPEIVPDTSFSWELKDLYFEWDHGKLSQADWRRDSLFYVENDNDGEPGANSWSSMQMFMRHNDDGDVYFGFYVNGETAFYNSPTDRGNTWIVLNNKDLKSEAGFSGSGVRDLSDALTFKLEATPGATGEGDWTLTFTVTNETTNQVIESYSRPNMYAVSSLRNGTPQWRIYDEDTPYYLFLHNGVKLYHDDRDLSSEAAFASLLDTDHDGMTDAWEINYSLNPADPSDAGLDNDQDLLDNISEFLLNTNPTLADTDGDLFSDKEELQHFTDPLNINNFPVMISSPEFSDDFDGSGLSDAWERSFGVYNLDPNADPDGDRRTNLEESREGTDPYDHTDAQFTQISSLSNGDLEVRWRAPKTHFNVRLLYSETLLSDWSTETTTPTPDAGDLCIEFNPVSAPSKKFFRSETTTPDTDGDGISDYAEEVFKLNVNTSGLGRPVFLDTDGDQIPDTESSPDLGTFIRLYGNQSVLDSAGNLTAGVPSLEQASRFLKFSTFGPTKSEILSVRELGFKGWIDDQMSKSPTLITTYTDALHEDFYGSRTMLDNYSYNTLDNFINSNNFKTGFGRNAILAEDQLRQRVAYALSQLLVISRQNTTLNGKLRGISDYYDIFINHAFGNYKDILREVTYHPCMGVYLTSAGNEPPRPALNQYPDENYTREIMQLFTCGLWMLNPDGSRQLDLNGEPIPSYTNDEITEGARVFTGMWFGGNYWGGGGWQDNHFRVPMEMNAEYHDFEEKTIINGTVIPARVATEENARLDVEDFLTAVFEHPNTAPFISKALIQLLVSDNPSPAYLGRVSAVFLDNGAGTRGDLGAVVKAILLDPEAHNSGLAVEDTSSGKLREPMLRYLHACRLLNLSDQPDLQWWDWGEFYENSFQGPLEAPSVFNFYSPHYSALKELRDNSLVGPVFQITNSYTSVSFPNRLWELIENGLSLYDNYQYRGDFRDFLAIAANDDLLLDYVNLMCCAGRMSDTTKQIILNAFTQLNSTNLQAKVKLALYLGMMCPEGAVQK